MKKLVSHLPPRHLDDFLALSVLKTIFKDAEIEYLHPQKIPEKYFENQDIILIDIGYRHNPSLNNFDHHQDINLPCSLSLVLKKFFQIKYNKYQLLDIIDKTDRFGLLFTKNFYAKRNIEIKINKETDLKRRIILNLDLKKYGDLIGNFLLENLSISYYTEFLNKLYDYLDDKKILEEAKKIVEQEEIEFKEKINNIKTIEIENIKIAILKEPINSKINEIFIITGADIAIQPNSMDLNQIAIIKNSRSAKYEKINLEKIFEKYKKVFIHNTGFMAIIDVPIQSLKIDDIKSVIK